MKDLLLNFDLFCHFGKPKSKTYGMKCVKREVEMSRALCRHEQLEPRTAMSQINLQNH